MYVAISEKPSIFSLPFGLGDKPCSGTAGIEIFNEHFGLEAFLLLGAERMILESRDDLFCERFYNIHILHSPERPDSKERRGMANDSR